MSNKITADVLEDYLKCKTKARLKLAGEQGQPTDYGLLLEESREHVRKAATAKLLDQYGGQDVPRGLSLTPDLLKQRHVLLLDAVFEDDDFAVRLDALVLLKGGYAPVLLHEAERATPELRLLLGLHGALLAQVQGKETAIGVLIHGRGCTQRKVKLVNVYRQARRVLREIREARTGAPPRLLLNAHCQVCEFRKRCREEATAKDDLSLLRGLSDKEIKKYHKRGIFTVTQLSFTFRGRRGRPPGRQGQRHQHALQALAIREKKVHILGTPELPSTSVRIYFDAEGEPDRDFDYLLGIIVVGDGLERRQSFWADTPTEEVRIFQQFLDLVGEHPDAKIYTYGSYEGAFLRRVAKATGQEEKTQRVLARIVNVLSVIHPDVYFPVYSNGLKDIAGHLGFAWSEPNASGLQSIVWRRQWEQTGSATWREKLVSYNLEDCTALRRVTEFLDAVCPGKPRAGVPGVPEVTRVGVTSKGRMHGWIDAIYGVPDFGYIHDRASFDYLRDRICFRTGKPSKKNPSGKAPPKWKKGRKVNREVEISSQACPVCGGTDLVRRPNGNLVRLAFDLRLTRSGIRSRVIRYRTAWHHCASCSERFLPPDYLRLKEFCHRLKSWAMYEHVAHRVSLPNLAETLRECFDLPIRTSQVHAMKLLLARYYEGTYKRLLEKIVADHLVHADETEIHVRRIGKAYVWVFTNLEEVVFLYRPSREGDFLHEVLKNFRGVLVSDFYAAYDSLPCPQQKCLIHLVRDFNQDILASPWDEELKSLAGEFGGLLKAVVATVDRYGLRRRHLGKHKRDVARFFEGIAESYRSEAAEGYRQRLLKCRHKLFTFLDHDDVPWHNNAAEHAIKAFAQYREVADYCLSEAGLAPYLILLSVQQTCKYKGVSFLKFLLSGETDIDVFRRGKTFVPEIELYPEGSDPVRQGRKRLEG